MSGIASVGSFVSGYLLGVGCSGGVTLPLVVNPKKCFFPLRNHEMPVIVAGHTFLILLLDDSAFSTGIKVSSIVVTILASMFHKANMQKLSESKLHKFLDKWSSRCFIAGGGAAALSTCLPWPIVTIACTALAAHAMPIDVKKNPTEQENWQLNTMNLPKVKDKMC